MITRSEVYVGLDNYARLLARPDDIKSVSNRWSYVRVGAVSLWSAWGSR